MRLRCFGRCALAAHALEAGGSAQRATSRIAHSSQAICVSAAGRGRAGVGGSWSRRLDPCPCMGLQAAVCTETPVLLSTSPHSTPTHWEVLGPPTTHKHARMLTLTHACTVQTRACACRRSCAATHMCSYAHALARACKLQGSAVLEPRLPRRSKRSLCWRTCAPSPARSTVVSRSQGRSGAIPACVPALSTAWV